MGPKCNPIYPYKKEAEGDLTTGLRNVKMEARAGGRDHELRNAGMEVDSPLEPPEELKVVDALTLDR